MKNKECQWRWQSRLLIPMESWTGNPGSSVNSAQCSLLWKVGFALASWQTESAGLSADWHGQGGDGYCSILWVLDSRLLISLLFAPQNIQPWEPRTFPLSDSAYRGLLQHSNEDGYNQADFQPWVSSNKQGIRPTSVDTVIPSFTGMQFSDTHLRTDVNKSHREVHGPALQPRKAWQQR